MLARNANNFTRLFLANITNFQTNLVHAASLETSAVALPSIPMTLCLQACPAYLSPSRPAQRLSVHLWRRDDLLESGGLRFFELRYDFAPQL